METLRFNDLLRLKSRIKFAKNFHFILGFINFYRKNADVRLFFFVFFLKKMSDEQNLVRGEKNVQPPRNIFAQFHFFSSVEKAKGLLKLELIAFENDEKAIKYAQLSDGSLN